MKYCSIIRKLPAFAMCALLPAVVANVKNPVSRPFKMEAQSQMVLNLADGSFNSTAWGEATHCGKSVLLGSGVFNPVTGEGSGWGATIIAANGDEIFFDMPSVTQNIITGGTGRFEGATGEFIIMSMETTATVIDPVAGTMTLSFVWTASGSITY